jgi:pyruvate,water dikinase
VVAEIGRRNEVATAAFANKIWRDAMARWDGELKPASIERHRTLGAIDVTSLDDAALQAHLHECMEQVSAMVYQHHRMNGIAVIPVGDLALHVSAWTGRSPVSVLGVFDGYSPSSNIAAPEMAAVLEVVRRDAEARAILTSGAAPASVLADLCARVPEAQDCVASLGFRLIEGFDLSNPTIGEQPGVIVGRLIAALEVDPGEARRRADALAASIRAEVPPEHRAEFDEMLADARSVYRLRDERGVYSEISAIGLLRLGLLELGSRLEGRGRVKLPEDILEIDADEIDGLFAGAPEPSAHELHDRSLERLALTLAGAPRFLGDPPPAPPPVDMLPPGLARVMSALGFMIDGILGQREEAAGDEHTVIGIPGAAGVYEGPARLVRSIDDLLDLEPGDVLVAPTTGEAFNSMLHLVGAIVTDHGSFASHAAIVAREMGIPAVVGSCNATDRIANGARVRVDGTTGEVAIL